MSTRTDALADRLEHGARELAAFARGLAPAEWQTRVPGDGRRVGVSVHHVATMYPLEMRSALRHLSQRSLDTHSTDGTHQGQTSRRP